MAYNVPLPAAPERMSILDAFMKMQNASQQLTQMPAQNALLQAKAKRENALASLPFGGQNLPGVAGQIQGLETIRQIYGEQSPQFTQAKQMFDLNNKSTQSRIDYQGALTNTLPQRVLTPTGKALVEGTRVGQGQAPTGQTWQQAATPTGQGNALPLTPDQVNRLQQIQQQGGIPQEQPLPPPAQAAQGTAQGNPPQEGVPAPGTPQDLQNLYNLGAQKANTDVDTRKRNLYATNIEKTLQQINPDDLTQYSGIKGNAKLIAEKAKDATKDITGAKTSPEYERYKSAIDASEFLASQVRQFYGESIQPSMREKLEQLTNPSTWMNSPETAKNLFNTTKKILGLEMKTYRDALKSPGAYQEQVSQGNEQPHAAHMMNANESGFVHVTGPDGSPWTIPANKVNDALKRGAKLAE